MSAKRMTALVVGAGLIAIQFIPADHSNPPVRGEIRAPAPVAEVLRRSCYDCHSNETHWPWYGYAAPLSWFLSHHVQEGREKLNFSTWSELDSSKRSETMHEVWEEVSKGAMPLRSYLILHPEAKLSGAALESIHEWFLSSRDDDGAD